MRRRLCSLFLVLSLLSLPAYAHQASETVTRGQFLLLLWRAGGEVPFDKTAHPFTDLEEDAFSQAALAQGAHVYVLPAAQMPSAKGVAALYRY